MLCSLRRYQGGPWISRSSRKGCVPQPATYFTDAAHKKHWRDLDFPSRKLRRRPTAADLAEFRTKQADLQWNAATQEQLNPVSFSSWTETVQDDKTFFHNNTMLRIA